MKNIIIPVDMSEASQNAVQYAIHLAKELQVKITLLHIVDRNPVYIHQSVAAGMATPEYDMVNHEESMKNAQSAFENFVQKNYQAQLNEGLLDYKVIIGFIPSSVIDEVNTEKYDLLLAPSDKDEGIFEFLIGSNNESFVEDSPCPTWLVPKRTKYHSIKQIIYTTNYHKKDVLALRKLSKLTEKFHAKIIILHVQDENESENAISAQQSLQSVVNDAFGSKSKNYEVNVIVGNDIAESVLDFSKNVGGDIVVMLKENKSFFKELFSQSSTNAMEKIADIPLLIFNERTLSEK